MLTSFLRTIILYFLLMLGLRAMGKRQFGELEPSELVMALLISDLAAVPMQDYGIPLVNGIIPILTLLALSMLMSFGSLHSIRFRRLFCGTPTLLIRDGRIVQSAMQKNRFTNDELFEELRTQGVSDLSDVKYAVLETNGQLSVLLQPHAQSVTPTMLGLAVDDDSLTLPVILISDGRLIEHNLSQSGHDRAWLAAELKKNGLSSSQSVYLLTVDRHEKTVCIKKDDTL